MGVSGSGKTLIGAALARALCIDFVEGDQYHSAENVKRMASGVPLTDENRAQWLDSLARRIAEAKRAGSGLVVTCSALKRMYRDVLRAAAPELQFIFLRGSETLLADRIAARRGHFMPPSLLDSQLATLEEPSAEEGPWVCDISASPKDIVADLVRRASA
jgi:gluconokinase